MITPDLQNYVTQSRASGMTDEQIRSALTTQGWQAVDTSAVLGFKKSWLRKLFGRLSILLWIIALFLPAYVATSSALYATEEYFYGYHALIFGFFGSGIMSFIAWLSNLPGFIALILFIRNKPLSKTPLVLAILAFMMSLGSLFVTKLVVTEAGHVASVSPALGAYVWISSMLVLMIGCVWEYNRSKNKS